jgi:hypothetical protein
LYSWNNGAATQCISGLAPGVYCVTITNRNGNQITCCYTLTAAPVTAPTVSFAFGNCGSSVTAVIGQTECQGYTYHWENNNTELIRNNLEACDTITFTILTCDGVSHAYSTQVPHVFPSISPVSCLTGLGRICVGTQCFRCEPYTYTLTGGGQSLISTTPCFQVAAGQYTLCITNSCGDVVCCPVFLPPPIPITVTVSHTNVTCHGYHNGTVMINASGGTAPYTGTGTFTNLGPGTYTYTVTDANGCSTTITVTITEPPPIIIIIFYPHGCPGDVISILGSNFTDATDVQFNGVSAANFNVISDDEIEAEVPVGATTGLISVVRNPCIGISIDTFHVHCDGVVLHVNLFLQGYYLNVGTAAPMDNFGNGGCLFVDGVSTNPFDADSITVNLVDSEVYAATSDVVFSTVETQTGILHTDGTLSVNYSDQVNNHSYYLVIRHRNHVETWSAHPVLLTSQTNYDFTDSYQKAYEFDGNAFHSMIEIEQGRWAIYCCDDNQDGFVDIFDIPSLTTDIGSPSPFGYLVTDLNGDGFVDIFDIPGLTTNIEYFNGVYSQHP